MSRSPSVDFTQCNVFPRKLSLPTLGVRRTGGLASRPTPNHDAKPPALFLPRRASASRSSAIDFMQCNVFPRKLSLPTLGVRRTGGLASTLGVRRTGGLASSQLTLHAHLRGSARPSIRSPPTPSRGAKSPTLFLPRRASVSRSPSVDFMQTAVFMEKLSLPALGVGRTGGLASDTVLHEMARVSGSTDPSLARQRASPRVREPGGPRRRRTGRRPPKSGERREWQVRLRGRPSPGRNFAMALRDLQRLFPRRPR